MDISRNSALTDDCLQYLLKHIAATGWHPKSALNCLQSLDCSFTSITAAGIERAVQVLLSLQCILHEHEFPLLEFTAMKRSAAKRTRLGWVENMLIDCLKIQKLEYLLDCCENDEKGEYFMYIRRRIK